VPTKTKRRRRKAVSPVSNDITRWRVPVMVALGMCGVVIGASVTAGVLYTKITAAIETNEKLTKSIDDMRASFDASTISLKSQLTDLREQQIRSDERLKWVAERIDRIEKGAAQP
jgi:septal ring factor EnvC (AmiA/AmiB activator)